MKKLLTNAIFIFLCITNGIAQLPSYVPTTGLVGYWPFNGNANDESGNNINGTVNGATTTSDRFGNASNAYNFNGQNNNIVIPNSLNLNPSLISVSIWVNPTSFGPSEQYIIDKSIDLNPGSVNRSWAIRIGGSGQLDLEIRVNNIYYSFSTTSALNLNQWNNLVFVYDGITAKLYKDNLIVISQGLPGTLTNFNYNLSIGYFPHANMPPYGYFWNGKLDDVGIWNRALTACEINQLYTSGVSPIVASSTSSTICSGSTSTLTASGATSYTWMPGNFPGTSLAVAPSVTTIYTVTGTNANGCSNTTTVNVNVNALPIVTAVSSASVVCAGNNVTLSAGGALNYVWSNGLTNAVSFVPTTNTTYTVTGTDANGCSKTATTSIVVNTLPNVTAASSASAVCAGNNVTLSAGGALNYVWSNGLTNAVSFVPTTNTTYTVTGTDTNGCSKTATTSVEVNALPVVTAASSASAVCAGNSVTLSGGGASTYVWSNGVTNAISFVPTNSATYTVTGTDANGCSNTATTSVTINPLPNVTAASSASAVCVGNSVALSGGGASSYVWSNGVTNAINFVPTNSATYTVTGTDANACSNTATTNVIVNTLPIVTAAISASAVCAGNSVTLSGGGASTYVWSNGVTNAISFIPTNSVTYTLTGTDANGCSNTATTIVTINALPIVTAASSASAACAGNSVTLSGGGASTYVWSNGVTNAISFTPTTNTTYTVTGTNANGCSNTATLSVVVNALPVVTAASSASAVCAGNSVTLSGGGASTYVWTGGVTNAVSFVPTNSATYTVTGTDANGCAKTATTSVVVNVLPAILVLASSQVYCPTDLAGTLSANPTGGFWSGNGVTGNSFDPLLSGFGLHNVVYSYTDANSCVNSATLIMTVNLCTGVNEITAENLFTVYPNPVSTEINIKADVTLIGSVYTIYDNKGKLVLSGKINSENTLIEVGNLSGGSYLLNVGDKTTRTFKVVKE